MKRFALGVTISGCLLASMLSPAASFAEPTKLFNAAHSLTGDCSTSKVDKIPDPNCSVASPPEGGFRKTTGIATDAAGDIYVVNRNPSLAEGKELYHIDVFNSAGEYITEVARSGALGVAVDSNGHLYVFSNPEDPANGAANIVRYDPTVYNPQAGEIEYGSSPVILVEDAVVNGGGVNLPGQTNSDLSAQNNAPVVDPSNDHVFLELGSVMLVNGKANPNDTGLRIVELGPPKPEEQNEVLEAEIGRKVLSQAEIEEQTKMENEQEPEGKLREEREKARKENEGLFHSKELLNVQSAMTFDPSNRRLYVADSETREVDSKSKISVIDLASPHEIAYAIDGSTTPQGHFATNGARLQLAFDGRIGHLFVGDTFNAKRIYELDETGAYVGTIEQPVIENEDAMLAVDNSDSSPNQGFLYVPTGVFSSPGHLFAFEPENELKPPVVETLGFHGTTETDTILSATINPSGQNTTYRFGIEVASGVEPFSSPSVVGEGVLAPSGEGQALSANAFGLEPGVTYRYRVVAENDCEPGGCADEKQGTFTTFSAYSQAAGDCPNDLFRTGASAELPDCRAFELVTPADTGGFSPFAPGVTDIGERFGTPPASPSGENVVFLARGGLIPGFEGTGSLEGDSYVSKRTVTGWQTESISPTGTQAVRVEPGGLSPDHGFAVERVAAPGSLQVPDYRLANYIRYPDGAFQIAGSGSLGTDPNVQVKYISSGGTHIIFETQNVASEGHEAVQLEPTAPPEGTPVIYDHTADGVTHVISILPGELTGEPGSVLGVSADGSSVAFRAGGEVYVRVNDEKTLPVAPEIVPVLGWGFSAFAGFSSNGRYVFYMKSGDLYRLDTQSESVVRISEAGDVVPVFIPSDGNSAYFVSAVPLGSQPNPSGEEPTPGGHNLYYWDGAEVHFVAGVTKRDVDGELQSTEHADGFKLWWDGQSLGSLGDVPARSSADGSTLIFASRASLTEFQAEGKAEIYRYDAQADSLSCISCDPTKGKPSGGASLIGPISQSSPVSRYSFSPNLSPDGRRAFFQTPDRLVPADSDGVTDVYEWEADGKGSCTDPRGCLFLISSGQSARPNYLYGVSESGDDVFIYSSDLLTFEDQDETASIYDARVGGGFAEPAALPGECLGETCQPATNPPVDVTPPNSETAGNVVPEKSKRSCGKHHRRAKKCGHRHKKKHRKRPARHKQRNRGTTEAHR